MEKGWRKEDDRGLPKAVNCLGKPQTYLEKSERTEEQLGIYTEIST